MGRNVNKKMRRAKKYHSVKYNNFKYETQYETFGHKVDEYSLIYCQDWFVDPSPEYRGKDFIFWDQIPQKYLKVPKDVGNYTYWMGWITFKDTPKWLHRIEDENGVEKWIWMLRDRPILNNDTTIETITLNE